MVYNIRLHWILLDLSKNGGKYYFREGGGGNKKINQISRYFILKVLEALWSEGLDKQEVISCTMFDSLLHRLLQTYDLKQSN